MANQNSSMLIKPESIDRIPSIPAVDKERYKVALTNLWQQFSQAAENSPQKADLENKIRQASSKILQHISSRSRPGAPGSVQAGQQQPGGGSSGGGQASSQGAQGGQPAQPAMNPANFSVNVKNYLSKIKLYPPPGMQGPQDFEKHKKEWYAQAGGHLSRQERAMQMINQLKQQAQQAQSSGQPIPPELQDKMRSAQQMQATASAAFREMSQKNETAKRAMEEKQQGGAAGGNPQMNGQQGGQPQVNGQMDNAGGVNQMPQSATAMSPQQAQGQFTQQQPNAPSQNAQNATPQQQPAPNAGSTTHTPLTATQPQPPQNFPQQFPNQQPPQRPQVNPQQAQQHPTTPGSGIPQSATGANPQRPQPLSHHDAMASAARSYSQQQAQQASQQTNQQPPPPGQGMPNPGMPYTQQMPQQQQTPTSSYGPGAQQQQQQQMSSAQTKFPIPKTLPQMTATTTPVPGPPSRPTMMANGGMMMQPGVQKPPHFTLEGEGDRVLSKRKLDELVRQVTGGGENDGLAPEVEEAVLTLADDFVDNVITSACRLAKLRSSQTLDIRDIQIVLERNYGIRIPGYSLDEVRTVRKFQPAAGWQQKMQAVQAGKVMGGSNRE